MERLAAGPVIGDGGFIFALEKRGFVKVFVLFFLPFCLFILLSLSLSRYMLLGFTLEEFEYVFYSLSP